MATLRAVHIYGLFYSVLAPLIAGDAVSASTAGAFVQLFPPKNRTKAALLRRHLLDRLPPHAVARRMRTVEKIPVSAAGKSDRAAAVDLLIR